MKRIISANSLKWIAIIAMVFDHVAWKLTASAPTLFFMHIIGRLTIPIMCFFISEGFHHTRNVKKYSLRLLIFAVISQVPFNYYHYGNPFRVWIGFESLNALFTLLLGLLALSIIKSERKPVIKVILVTFCILGSVLCDWPVFGLLFVLAFGLNKSSFKKQVMWFTLTAVSSFIFLNALFIVHGDNIRFIEIGLLLTLPLLALYNGKLSGDNTPEWVTNKWIFYVFYPLHMLVIGFFHFGLGVLS